MKGIKSKTGWYNLIYTVFKPLYFILKPFKGAVTNSNALTKAIIQVTLTGYDKKIIENKDINKIAESLN